MFTMIEPHAMIRDGHGHHGPAHGHGFEDFQAGATAKAQWGNRDVASCVDRLDVWRSANQRDAGEGGIGPELGAGSGLRQDRGQWDNMTNAVK